jgi:Spy/CpxP family protein refolding chaperone
MFAKTTKAIVGALVLTSVSFAVTASAYSAPRWAPSQASERYMTDRHNPTDTNGF